MKVNSWQCDICGVQKKDANRWWKVYSLEGDRGILIAPWDAVRVSLTDEQPVFLALDDAVHLCGEQHVMEWLSKTLPTIEKKELPIS